MKKKTFSKLLACAYHKQRLDSVERMISVQLTINCILSCGLPPIFALTLLVKFIFNLNFAHVSLCHKVVSISPALYEVPSQKSINTTRYSLSSFVLYIVVFIYVSVTHRKLYVWFLEKR